MELLPEPKPKKVFRDLSIEGLWVVRDAALLLAQRPQGGAMAGLWELPTRRTAESPESPLWATHWPSQRTFQLGESLQTARHSITHHRISMQVYRAETKTRPASPYRWFEWRELGDLAITGLTKKSIAQLAPDG